jgi:uncharacterized membrane protein YfcA
MSIWFIAGLVAGMVAGSIGGLITALALRWTDPSMPWWQVRKVAIAWAIGMAIGMATGSMWGYMWEGRLIFTSGAIAGAVGGGVMFWLLRRTHDRA